MRQKSSLILISCLLISMIIYSCRKEAVRVFQEQYLLEKQYLKERGGVFKNGTLSFSPKKGLNLIGNLDWSTVKKYSFKGVDYTEVLFKFGEIDPSRNNITQKSDSTNSDEINFSIVFRRTSDTLQAILKYTLPKTTIFNGDSLKIGKSENFYSFNGQWINSWFTEFKSGRLLKKSNSPSSLIELSSSSANNTKKSQIQKSEYADYYCYTYLEKWYYYQCKEYTDNDQRQGSLDMSPICGYWFGGYITSTYCYYDLGSGGNETWPPGDGGGSTSGDSGTTPPSEQKPDCATFENKVLDILDHEGGFTNNPNDPGGATNKGISWDVWQDNAQKVLGVQPTLQNLQNLTDNQAKDIYRSLYWDPIHADQILDGDLRYFLFDFYVNAGGNAVKVLQRTINQLGGSVVVDGVIGNNTLNAIGSLNYIKLYNTFKTNRQEYYNKLAARSSKLATFLNGWTNRVNKFENKTALNNKNVNC